MHNVLVLYLLEDRHFALQALLQLSVQSISRDLFDSDDFASVLVLGLPDHGERAGASALLQHPVRNDPWLSHACRACPGFTPQI